MEPLFNWEWVPPAAGASNRGTIGFSYHLDEKHRIRIKGQDILSSLSADTDTIEIDGELLDPLCNLVWAELSENRSYEEEDEESIKWFRRSVAFQNRAEARIADAPVGFPSRKVQIADWS